ncbi:hypothetical protein GCM10007276_17210 [Agaricicola taiwanensis]|uniref:Methyltransferase domain-containing protein n=1 Tax=Agaricicola taiwanensis TaxID=591372 RepID=A0A8J2VUI9_9RHOB|nr:class I SAM-dependent methyltransferase [Agaricicola taiwanensis]GGE40444.1 hypothetical protein GCM10007276_17210 [Agaricicola taiwanensis]
MPAWNSGYVTDTDCTYGFYRDLAPSALTFANFLAGNKGPDVNAPLTYCELGCGQGFSTNLLAAANPHIEFYATDFLPEHIVNAQDLARDAGLRNVHFYDQGFADFIDEPELPQFDIIALHGIYSWVDAEARRDVVRFIQKKLKLGGLVFVSYNCLPGLASETPVQRLLTMAQDHGTTSQRIAAGLDLVQRLKATRTAFFVMNPSATIRLDGMSKSPHTIAHEYFNATFKSWWHAEVAHDLAEAKLSFSASCALLQEAHGIYLTDEQRQLLAEAPHDQRQTLIDFMYNRMFRRDVFVKGSVSLPTLTRDEMWNRQRFALLTPRSQVPALSVPTIRGKVELSKEIYDPLLDAFAEGPRTLGSITDPRVTEMPRAALREAMLVLNGLFHLCPCLDEAGEEKRRATTQMLNWAVIKRAVTTDELDFLASPVTGNAHPVNHVQQLFLLSGSRDADKASAFAWEHLQRLGRRMTRDGVALEAPADNLAELADIYRSFEDHDRPLLEQLGIV